MQYDPGKRTQVDIPKKADVLGDMYLEIRLPSVPGLPTGSTWGPCVGYTLLRRTRLLLNDQEIHNIERLWLDLYDRLNVRAGHSSGLDQMVGRTPLPMNSDHILYVPLRFLTCRPGVSRAPLPLQAIANASLKLDIEWERPEVLSDPTITVLQNEITSLESIKASNVLEKDSLLVQLGLLQLQQSPDSAEVASVVAQIASVDSSTASAQEQINQKNAIIAVLSQDPGIQVSVLVEYTELEDPEKSGMLKGGQLAFESVIDSDATNYYIDSDGDIRDVNTVNVNLGNVRFAVKGLVWVAYDETGPLFTYLQQPLSTAVVTFNKQHRLEPKDSMYYELVQQYQHTRNCSLGPPSIYSFALDMSSRLNWGTADFAGLSEASLQASVRPGMPRFKIKVFSVYYNFLDISSFSGRVLYV